MPSGTSTGRRCTRRAGLVGLVVTARIPYAFWRRAAIPMLLALLPVMLLTLHPAIGSSFYGASRWIDLGPITLQPAEFAKLLMVAAAAAILSRPWKDLTRPRDVFLPLGPLVLVVAGLVLLQRDLGTTLIICGSVFLILFTAGVRLASSRLDGPGRGRRDRVVHLQDRVPAHAVPGGVAQLGARSERRGMAAASRVDRARVRGVARGRPRATAARSGTTSPTRTATSCSPSSARSSG